MVHSNGRMDHAKREPEKNMKDVMKGPLRHLSSRIISPLHNRYMFRRIVRSS